METSELGLLTDLSPNRVRSYESGVRVPKPLLLEKFAEALGFPMEYFTDHKIDSYADFFQVFFELEDNIGLTVEPTADGKCSKEEYDIWRARFPISVADDMHADMRNRMKNNSENDK